MKFILLLLSDCFQLRHHRIVTDGEQIYSFVPHSHAILHSFDASGLLSFWVLHDCFSFWILVQAPLSIVSFCVRDILISTHGRRRTFEQSYSNWFCSVCLFDVCFLPGSFFTLLSFWLSFVAWDHLNIIQVLNLLPLHGSFVVSLLG